MNMPDELLIGRYAEPGLIRVQSDRQHAATDGLQQTRNVSFACYSPRHRRIYAVREDEDGRIDVLGTEGGLEWIAQVSSGGEQPCHCALDAGERYLAIANYGSGELSMFELDPGNELPLQDEWHCRGAGQGPDKRRQAGPHAHWVGFAPDQRWLIYSDLGADRIRAFPFDPGQGVTGGAQDAYVAPAGSGPRWLAFAGSERALLVSELSSTVSLLAWRDGAFELLDCCTTSSAAGEGNLGGHIVLDQSGAFAYVTNRGDDTIAVIAITGDRLRVVDSVASGGTSPRFLCWLADERMLLVAHEKEGPITRFERTQDGRLSPQGPSIDVQRAAWLMPWPPGTAAKGHN